MRKQKERICIECNEKHKRPAPLCQKCYLWHKTHPNTPIIYPKKSQVLYTNDNNEIYCWYCGKSYTKIFQHIRYAHNISKNDACDEQRLYHTHQYTGLKYREKMKQYNYENRDIVVNENLIKSGINTRYKKEQIVKGRGKHIKEV